MYLSQVLVTRYVNTWTNYKAVPIKKDSDISSIHSVREKLLNAFSNLAYILGEPVFDGFIAKLIVTLLFFLKMYLSWGK